MKFISVFIGLLLLTNSFALELSGNPFKEKILYIGLDVSKDTVKCKDAIREYIGEALKTISWGNLRKGNIRQVNIFLFDNQVRATKTVFFTGSSMSRANWKKFERLIKVSLRQLLKDFKSNRQLHLRDMTAAFDYIVQMQIEENSNRQPIAILFTGAFQQFDRKIIQKLQYNLPKKTFIVSAFGKCLYETYSQRKIVFERFVKNYWINIKNIKWILLP